MKIYAETANYRSKQLFADAVTTAWIVLWVRVGLHINELVNRLAAPGRAIENAGSDFADTLGDASREVADVPVVGGVLRVPLETAAGAGRVLQDAGQSQHDVIHTLAFWLGLVIAIVPICYAIYQWLPWRTRWIREASAAHKLRIDADDLELFALRAIATRSLQELRRVAPDPAASFAAGDFEPLAALELKRLGLETAT